MDSPNHVATDMFEVPELAEAGRTSSRISLSGDDLFSICDSWFADLPATIKTPEEASKGIPANKEKERSITPSKTIRLRIGPFAPNTAAKTLKRPLLEPEPAPQKRNRIDSPSTLADDSDFVIDVAESRLANTQRAALRAGRSTKLSWQYDEKDQLTGAICDGQWFGRAELVALSTL